MSCVTPGIEHRLAVFGGPDGEYCSRGCVLQGYKCLKSQQALRVVHRRSCSKSFRVCVAGRGRSFLGNRVHEPGDRRMGLRRPGRTSKQSSSPEHRTTTALRLAHFSASSIRRLHPSLYPSRRLFFYSSLAFLNALALGLCGPNGLSSTASPIISNYS